MTGVQTCALPISLEKHGLVKRKVSKTDKRLVLAELTSAGKTMIEWVFPKFNQGEADVAGTLTEPEQLELARLLRKVVAGFQIPLEQEVAT